jgi:F-type H+-transporting ATPase subunit epsilon
MSNELHLMITTPAKVLVDDKTVLSVRAMDESGCFGILPGHTDLITVLPGSVVHWHDANDQLRFCAVRSGVFSVARGNEVRIACQEGLVGDNLERLDAMVREHRAAERNALRQETAKQMRLHTQAIRQIMGYLHPTEQSGITHGNLSEKLS